MKSQISVAAEVDSGLTMELPPISVSGGFVFHT